jgi:2TM domain-containing protein
MGKDRAMRGFLIHFGIFVGVVGLLAAINLFRNPQHLWFIWVLAGWGIGLAAHDLALLLQRTGRTEALFTDAKVRGFFIHVFVYATVNALLIIVNLMYMPTYHWFVYPLVAWGVVLAAHAYAVFFRKRPASARTTGTTTTGAKR